MKLIGVSGSNNVRKVLAVANHLNLDLEVEHLDFFLGDLQKPEFLALNPNGKVPVLVDGDFVLWESNAINCYLCSMAPGNTLYPDNPKVRADIDRWLSWELAHYNNAFGALSWEAIALPGFLGQEGNPVIIERSKELLSRYARILDQHLKERTYAVGNDITLADYALIHIEVFKENVPFDWSPYPHLNAYYERMREVPHWKNTAVSPEQMGRKPA